MDFCYPNFYQLTLLDILFLPPTEDRNASEAMGVTVQPPVRIFNRLKLDKFKSKKLPKLRLEMELHLFSHHRLYS